MLGPAASAIGVKVAAGPVTGVRADLDGTVLDTFSAPFDSIAANPFDGLAALLAPQIAAAGKPRLLGVGLGVPGFVDSRIDLVQAPLLGWRNMPLRDYLATLLGVPVLVDSDVNTLAAYEHLNGLGRSYRDFLTVTLGRGVGAAVVCGGDLRRGGHGAAGELGHLPVDPDGPACHCGKRGCLETFVSDAALVSQAQQAGVLGPDAGPADLRAAADGGDQRARAISRAAGARLGTVVAGLATVLDPEAVLVSGEGTLAWPHLADGFFSTFHTGLLPAMAGAISVHVDPWDDAKWALGAAALVLQAPFTMDAEPLDAHVPAMTLFRAMFFLPVVTSWVAVSLLWKWLLNPATGVVNRFLEMLGLPGPGWWTDPDWAIPSVVLASVWKDVGFVAVLLLAGLQAAGRMGGLLHRRAARRARRRAPAGPDRRDSGLPPPALTGRRPAVTDSPVAPARPW